MSSLKSGLDGLKTFLAAIVWEGTANKLFAGVEFTTDAGAAATRRSPLCLIRVNAGRPYANHSTVMWIFDITLEIRQRILPGEFGDEQILDRSRETNKSKGAGLAEIFSELVKHTEYIDSADNANIKPHIRHLGVSGFSAVDEIATFTLDIEAKIEVNAP